MRHLLLMVSAWIGASALAQTSPSGAPPTTGPIPLESFTRFDEIGGVQISPDGEFLVVLTGKYGRSKLVFVELQSRKAISSMAVPEDCEIDEYYWVSPTRLIYMIAQRQRANVRPTPTGEIFAVDRDGTGAAMVYGYRAQESTLDTHIARRKASYATPELLSTLKRDPNAVLIAEHPWRNLGNVWVYDPDAKPLISRLNVYNGDKKRVDAAPLSDARLLVDRDDNVRFALGESELARTAVSWKPQPGADWTSFDLQGFREGTVSPFYFSADNRSVYLTGVREGEQYAALYRLDLETRQLDKVHAFANMDVDGLVTDFTDSQVVGAYGYAERHIDAWLADDNPAVRTYQALHRAFPGQRVRVTSTSDDGRLAIVLVESDVNPGDYYVFDTVNKRADFLYAGRIWIEPKQMRPKEPFALRARDGLELHGYVTRPAGEGPYPTVVMPHGGPHGVRDEWEFDPEVQLLASRGYAVLQVNFRGSGGYGIDFEHAGYGEWGGKMQDDITDAVRWAIEQKIAAADRICIYGVSYGGYAALMSASREPDLYRCAIGYAGVYDLPLLLDSGDLPDSRSGQAYLQRVLGTDVAKLRAQSPVYNAQNIKAPVLLIHGKVDRTADYEHAKLMRAALERNNKKFEWLTLAGEGHGAYDESTRREVAERILQFLAANLRTPQPAAPPTAGSGTP